jgi:Flp pilus assembly pilin Flp
MTTAISTFFITVLARLHAMVLTATEPRSARRARGEDGQATTEYALVLLAAALVALLVVAWATAGGGAAKIGRLFDRVIDAVTDRI